MPASDNYSAAWYRISNENSIPSPALIVYPERIRENIRRTIDIAGNASRLWTHVKTHKMSEVVKLQTAAGIRKFKCATIAEAEMVASCGAESLILAMQPVGPGIKRFVDLSIRYPEVRIGCIADDEGTVRQIGETAVAAGTVADIWLDVNTGMNRTGIAPGEKAEALYRLMSRLPGLRAAGLHVYDGHLHDKAIEERTLKCNAAFAGARELADRLVAEGLQVPAIVAGGTPTFPVHAVRRNTDCSPGTLILWDYKSSSSFPDMDFLHAAVLLCRVVSRPARGLLCIDLGHKAVASEMPHPRIRIFGIDSYSVENHSEEHMVIRTDKAQAFRTGDVLYCIPYHICPTSDRYDTVVVAENGMATGEWKVDAHARKITI